MRQGLLHFIGHNEVHIVDMYDFIVLIKIYEELAVTP